MVCTSLVNCNYTIQSFTLEFLSEFITVLRCSTFLPSKLIRALLSTIIFTALAIEISKVMLRDGVIPKFYYHKCFRSFLMNRSRTVFLASLGGMNYPIAKLDYFGKSSARILSRVHKFHRLSG